MRAGLIQRVVEPELLDELLPADPRAVRARRYLHRVNALMRNHTMMAELLRTGANGQTPKNLADLGAGAGDFLLGVARRLSPEWTAVSASLIDRQNVASSSKLTKFSELGWRAEFVFRDAFDWLRDASKNPPEVVMTNLFLHEFENPRIATLLYEVAKFAKLFVAIEPRRARWPLFCSRLLWLMGCNQITRHDGVASVRAGFVGCELSALWPANNEWVLTEQSGGLFSHVFVARRRA